MLNVNKLWFMSYNDWKNYLQLIYTYIFLGIGLFKCVGFLLLLLFTQWFLFHFLNLQNTVTHRRQKNSYKNILSPCLLCTSIHTGTHTYVWLWSANLAQSHTIIHSQLGTHLSHLNQSPIKKRKKFTVKTTSIKWQKPRLGWETNTIKYFWMEREEKLKCEQMLELMEAIFFPKLPR